MIDQLEAWLRSARHRVSRAEWSVRRLGLSVSEATQAMPGLVLVQLDGIFHDQLLGEIAANRMPFVGRLISIEGYHTHPLTVLEHGAAALEAELLYGVEQPVEFPVDDDLSPEAATRRREAALAVEQGLNEQAAALLDGGSKYGGFFSGGAKETHFCAAHPGFFDDVRAASRWLRLAVLLGHGGCALRAGSHWLHQSLLTTADGLRGNFPARELRSQLGLVSQWVRRGVLLRDLAAVGAAVDTARGLPAVHVAIDGRGPQRRGKSAGGRRTIWGIDRALRQIWLAARRSTRRDYDVWFYGGTSANQSAVEAAGAAGAGFALLPGDAPVPTESAALRPKDLRQAALHMLGRAPLPTTARPVILSTKRDTLRVMTYNVHSCLGMDGKLSPARIARVIAQCNPDVVALQELDVRRARTNSIDQAEAIAQELKMEFHFHPALALAEELYGDAVLSRFPLKLVHAGALPGLLARPELEPRGALWVEIEFHGRRLQLINTHLGLVADERMQQADALLGPKWLGHAGCKAPTILCGDFNAVPSSRVCRRLSNRLLDAQLCLEGHRPKRTFFARYPVGRIDHVYVSRDLEVLAVEVPRNDLILRASDHLPVIVEMRLPESS